MRALLPITTDDLPPHIQDLRTAELSLFIVRGDALAGELTITSLAHTASGQTVTTSEMTTSGGIISTRRPAGGPGRCCGTATRPGPAKIRLPTTI